MFTNCRLLNGKMVDDCIVFQLSMSAVKYHNKLAHQTLRNSLPPRDTAIINGLAICQDHTERLIDKSDKDDVYLIGLQRQMQTVFEGILAEQKAFSERQIGHLQKEVLTWQQRYEELERKTGHPKDRCSRKGTAPPRANG